MVTPQPRLPTPSEFYEPLLVTLGLATDFQPGLGMHMDRLFFPTLKRFGINDKERKRYQQANLLYPERGNPHTPTLWRKYQLAFRYMREGCVRGEGAPRVFQEEPKIWKLTPFGADLAMTMAPVKDADDDEFFLEPEGEPRENLTLLWFRQNWTNMQPKVRAHLAKNMESSVKQDLTDDHIHTYIERAIRKDSFHDHLESGNKIYPATLCRFVLLSAYSEIRNWGSDPSCKSLRGALSKRDRDRAEQWHKENPNYSRYRVHSREHQRTNKGLGTVFFESNNENRATGAVLDSYGGDLETDVSASMSMADTISTIAETLNETMPNGEEAFEMFVMKEVKGMTYKEVAVARAVTESRATSIIKKARIALREAAESGQLDHLS